MTRTDQAVVCVRALCVWIVVSALQGASAALCASGSIVSVLQEGGSVEVVDATRGWWLALTVALGLGLVGFVSSARLAAWHTRRGGSPTVGAITVAVLVAATGPFLSLVAAEAWRMSAGDVWSSPIPLPGLEVFASRKVQLPHVVTLLTLSALTLAFARPLDDYLRRADHRRDARRRAQASDPPAD